MGLIFLLLVGAILGWVAAIMMRAEDSRGIQLNIAVGIAGAMFAGIVLNPLLNGGSIVEGSYSVDSLLTASLGTVAMLCLLNVLRSRETR
ncbi:GlsB/YeaQ/YmgE family stress response membrane protein [Altererythrobacter sp. Root672]|uniref:GlsB/YeaQ/YmgE family stress response membrane protein n=1 Tax=Altererythrobacter sp. Root672 TaxID=1736584 RepID=UPI0006F424E7|nr:GlsB/YeaQ/YmgE family stress response membrane protein [Altererythrobacter sp. Root672]KRA80395.1 transglycosylase [Altererythrobacter sp. Root672]